MDGINTPCEYCGSPLYRENGKILCSNRCREVECPHGDGQPCPVCQRLGQVEMLLWPELGPRQRRGRKLPERL